jgi:hypothetical protein
MHCLERPTGTLTIWDKLDTIEGVLLNHTGNRYQAIEVVAAFVIPKIPKQSIIRAKPHKCLEYASGCSAPFTKEIYSLFERAEVYVND